MNRLPLGLALCLVLIPAIWARQDPRGCATHPEIGKERLFLHRQAQRARAKTAPARVEAVAPPAARDVGQLVILEDSDGVVGRLNPFNLDGRTVAFSPTAEAAARYRFLPQEASFDAAAADAGSRIDLSDDDTRQITLPFAFPFFGASYQRMFVNSDGNLTFTAGDDASNDRSLGRVTAGPPRIAGLFRDLDPSKSQDGVRALLDADRVVVSWSRVPEYTDTGIGPLQTFQIRIFPDGRIEVAFSGVTSREAVVGISPGRLQEKARSFHSPEAAATSIPRRLPNASAASSKSTLSPPRRSFTRRTTMPTTSWCSSTTWASKPWTPRWPTS